MDRVPPYSDELERAVLGALLVDGDIVHSVKGLLAPEDFYSEQNRRVFSSMLSICDSNWQIDVQTVGEHLRRNGELEGVGGLTYLGELMSGSVTSVNTLSHAKQVKALAAQRGLLYAAQEIAARAYQAQENVNEFLGESMTTIINAASANTGNDPIHVGHQIIKVSETAMSGAATIMREPTGIIEIDNKIHGLPKKKLTVVGGRPSMGKSTIVLNAAWNIAARGPVLVFTLEDDIQSQQSRLVSKECGVPYFDMDSGGIPYDKHAAITLATARVAKSNIWFEENRLTADEICQKAIAFRGIRGGCRLCVIDHLGYVSLSKDERRMSKYECTSAHVRRFAFLAKELKCPVLLCVQLNRQVETRPDKRPGLSDLRDSGTIEEDARQVIMLYRPSVYDETASKHEMEVRVVKNSQGPTGIISLNCDITCCRIGGGREY